MDLKSLLPKYEAQIKSDFEYVFTIFTPVYNRANTIKRVFDSLKNQTYKNFELVIINDGSTDNSHEVITDLVNSSNFPIQYINNTENRHKLFCMFQAVKLAKGEFFLTLDSDDACVNDALETFKKVYDDIPDNLKEQVCSLTSLCKDQYGNLIGEKFESDLYYSSTFKNMIANKYSFEKWGFTKTQVLKGIKINDYIYSKGLIPEGTIWNLLSKENFKTLYFNKILRIYYIDTENSLSSGHIENNALGRALYSLANINWFYKTYLLKNPILFLKQIYLLLLASKYLEYSRHVYSKAIDSILISIIFNCCWPFRKLITTKPLT